MQRFILLPHLIDKIKHHEKNCILAFCRHYGNDRYL
jgi:hypothetical protein